MTTPAEGTAQSVDRGPRRKGLVLVYTGEGKGKTTAALGLALRALGRGLRVLVIQFLKSPAWKTGEQAAARRFPRLRWLTLGAGFTWTAAHRRRGRTLAARAWRAARKSILAGREDVVILDEMNLALRHRLIPLRPLLAALKRRPAHLHVVLTGRGAPKALLKAADLVTEMRAVKHPFERGVPGQAGVDW
jgi:cob(I)alamin adenosyltransferase